MSKPKKMGKPLKIFLIIYIPFLTIVLTAMVFIICIVPEVRFPSQPEQSVRVEVTEKKIERHTTSGGRGYGISTIFSCRISFQFSDGTVKELEADKLIFSGVHKETPSSSVYHGINEGDTGILTYKELDRGAVDFFDELSLRKFISFEQDAECGGVTFRWIDRDRTNKVIVYGFLLLLLSAVVFFFVYTWRYHKKIQMAKEQRKLQIREKVEQQAAEQKRRHQEEDLKRKAQEEQQQKRKRQKQRRKKQRK